LTGADAGLRRELLLRLSLPGASKQHPLFLTLSSASMRTLYIRHVPDEVDWRADNAKLLKALPWLPIERASILEALSDSRVEC